MCRRQGLAGKLFPQGVAHVQLKPVQETNLHFLYFVGFFQTVKKKKILKRENDKKKKILVHEIKIFFFISWSSFMWIYWGGFVVPEKYLKTQQENLLLRTISYSLPIQKMVLLQDGLQDTGMDEARGEGFATTFYFK